VNHTHERDTRWDRTPTPEWATSPPRSASSVDEFLADLVKRGRDSDVFAQHRPAGILSQVAYGVVFAIADSDLRTGPSAPVITERVIYRQCCNDPLSPRPP
jgi:hypothetical protein